MQLSIMSRREAIAYCHRKNPEPTVMISISDPYETYNGAPFCSPENRVRRILRLSFSDADRPGPDVYGREAAEADLMTDGDGAKVAAFLSANPGVDLIVHCDAGVSRSAGVAAGILKGLTGDDSAIFDNFRFRPNMWCYRKTLAAILERRENGE